MSPLVRLVALAAAVELGLVVLTGGLAPLGGPVGPRGLLVRLVVLAALVPFAAARRADAPATRWSRSFWLLVLLGLVGLLHTRGYRLRGDALWMYPVTRSLVFDGDLDLGNEYRWYRIDDLAGSQVVPATGYPRNTYPVGAPLLWTAFVGAGHLGAWIRNRHGLPTAYDGYAEPYLHAVALGSLLLGWMGLLLTERTVRRWFPPGIALAATAGVGLGSFLLWYLAYQPVYTHAPTFFLLALLVHRFVAAPRESPATDGLLLGLAGSVRWQSLVFGLLGLVGLLDEARSRPPGTRLGRLAARAGAFGAAVLVGLAPQLLFWKIVFGRFWIGVPLGPDYMRWSEPFLVETLFSSRHGLFSWSPILLFATAGLVGFLRRAPLRIGLPLVGLVLVSVYVNASVADWWGGGAFGARRFDATLPILALGLATVLAAGRELVRRRPGLALAALLAAFVGGNALLAEQYRKGRLPADDTISWEAAGRAVMEDVFDAVGYPFSFPANWAFALRYDRPKTQFDILVGKYLFHLQNNLGGRIDLGPGDAPFLGNGWSSLRDGPDGPRSTRWAVASPAGLLVPTAEPETLRVVVRCAAAGGPPQPVEIRLNGTPLARFVPSPRMREHAVVAPGRLWRRLNLLELASDAPPPFLVVDGVRFERVAAAPGAR